MKNTLLLTSILALLFSACSKDRVRVKGSGPVVTQERSANAFDEVKLENSIKVIWHFSTEPRIEVEAQENIAEILLTEQRGNSITIKYKNFSSIKTSEDVIVHLYSEEASKIKVSGSGVVEVENNVNAEDLEMRVSGSGKITSRADNLKTAKVDISGSGKIILEGLNQGESLDCEISGSGELKSFDQTFKTSDVDISGSGKVEVAVEETLDVKISGSGRVTYKGSPTVNSEVSGSGKIVKF